MGRESAALLAPGRAKTTELFDLPLELVGASVGLLTDYKDLKSLLLTSREAYRAVRTYSTVLQEKLAKEAMTVALGSSTDLDAHLALAETQENLSRARVLDPKELKTRGDDVNYRFYGIEQKTLPTYLRLLPLLSRLESVNISRGHYDDTGKPLAYDAFLLAVLAKVDNLKDLKLFQCFYRRKFSNPHLADAIANKSSLVSLALNMCIFEDVIFDKLFKNSPIAPRLRCLDLSYSVLSAEQLKTLGEAFAAMPALTELNLDCFFRAQWSDFGSAPGVVGELERTARSEAMSALEKISSLKKFTCGLDHNFQFSELNLGDVFSSLRANVGLQELVFSWSGINENFFEGNFSQALLQFKELKSLDILQHYVDDVSCGAVQEWRAMTSTFVQLPNLERLKLAFMDLKEITSEQMSSWIPQMPKLQELRMARMGLDKQDLVAVLGASCHAAHLKLLDLGYNAACDDGVLEAMRDLVRDNPGLEKVIVSANFESSIQKSAHIAAWAQYGVTLEFCGPQGSPTHWER